MSKANLAESKGKVRTAGEAGWHASRYNIAANIPNSNMIAVYNTFTRSCGEYTPLEVFLLSVVDELDENHSFYNASQSAA